MLYVFNVGIAKTTIMEKMEYVHYVQMYIQDVNYVTIKVLIIVINVYLILCCRITIVFTAMSSIQIVYIVINIMVVINLIVLYL